MDSSTAHRRRSGLRPLALLLAWMAAGAVAPAAGAQERPRTERASVEGTVVDAYSQIPLADASVVLEPRSAGALPTPGRALVQATRTARTDAAGRYRFTGVPAGDYRLHVERLGYRTATVDVDLRGAPESRVSVGLDVEPVALQPVEVTVPAVDPAEPYGRTSAAGRDPRTAGRRRVEVERARQERYLASDVRAVTHADVAEGITLGETDLFRALQRLPGVSAGDEYSAELWTRGAPWDQTRVHLDGLPLFNPVHALGGFSGVNPDAVGAAFLHPGVQPASLGGGAAGILDVRTRPGGGTGELRGLGELSVVSARGALDRSTDDGRQAWMLAGRRTYLDLATGAAEAILGSDRTYHLPYRFSDVAGRWDRQLGDGSALEVSGLLELDRISSTNPRLLDRISAEWGGGMSRATLQNRFGGVRARHTVGFSGLFSSLRGQNEDRYPVDPGNIDYRPAIVPASGGILYTLFRGELEPATDPAPAPWQAGYELVHQRVRFRGPRPLPLALIDPAGSPVDRDHELSYGALWGSRRWTPTASLTVTTGLRAEAGDAVRNGGGLRLAPRLAARLQAAPGLSLSAAVGRSFQYVQALTPSGAPVDEGFRSDYLWVLAGDTVPVARADVATLGAEHWLGAGWLGSVTGYLRRTTGVALPDPTPGLLRERPLFVAGVNDARGVELSLRRLTGPWTASAAYSYGVSEMEAAGRRFPAPWDQRHVLDLTGMVQVSRRWQVGAAYTAAGGTPYTETFQGRVRCRRQGDCEWAEEPWAGEPGARRLPAYQSLDLLAEWSRSFRRWELGVFLQIHNALNQNNPGRYKGFGGEYCMPECHGFAQDEFTAGLPAFLVFGFRAAF
ncbi:MAG TPA: TonB-dependent receptor [Longimicrobiaceae bacterium]|nr:TonB-dependent receptor [Longimicrobiaceae bacterium]